MKEFIEKLIEVLEEYQENNTLCKSEDDYELGVFCTCEYVIETINKHAEEYNNGWIPCSGCKDCQHKECEHYGEI